MGAILTGIALMWQNNGWEPALGILDPMAFWQNNCQENIINAKFEAMFMAAMETVMALMLMPAPSAVAMATWNRARNDTTNTECRTREVHIGHAWMLETTHR